MRAILILAALLLASPALTESRAAEQPAWQVCFTPGQDCTSLIVNEIGAARRSILVQAYSFTSPPILVALKAAHLRGVDVMVIVDKTSAGPRKSGTGYSAATYLGNARVPVWVDYKVAIAHNKVMVIDDGTVITGSFNFTVVAQSQNAENLVVIEDRALAAKYRGNWERRRAVSLPYGAQAEIPPVEEIVALPNWWPDMVAFLDHWQSLVAGGSNSWPFWRSVQLEKDAQKKGPAGRRPSD